MGEIQNYLNFIKTGNFSNVVADALKQAETKSENLKQEIESLEFQKANTFQAPPREWIEDRLENLCDTLNKNTIQSANVLKELLGEVYLEPVSKEKAFKNCVPFPDKNNGLDKSSPYKPYYIAHSKLQTLALFNDKSSGPESSNWFQWRRR